LHFNLYYIRYRFCRGRLSTEYLNGLGNAVFRCWMPPAGTALGVAGWVIGNGGNRAYLVVAVSLLCG